MKAIILLIFFGSIKTLHYAGDYIRLVPMIKDLLGIVLWTFLIKVELLVELCYQTLVPVLQIFQREKFLA